MSQYAITREDRAYMAGLFEGEGCVYYLNNKYFSKRKQKTLGCRRIGIKITMTVKEPLLIFEDLAGRGSVREEKRRTINNLVVYTYCTTKFEDVQYIMTNMWFWLSPRRKEQYETAIRKYLNTGSGSN